MKKYLLQKAVCLTAAAKRQELKAIKDKESAGSEALCTELHSIEDRDTLMAFFKAHIIGGISR